MSEPYSEQDAAACQVAFMPQTDLRLPELTQDLDGLCAIVHIGLMGAVASRYEALRNYAMGDPDFLAGMDMPPQKVLEEVRSKDAEEYVRLHSRRSLNEVRVKRLSFKSPLELTLSVLDPWGWIAVGAAGIRYVIYIVERWYQMRTNVAENRLQREAAELLRETLVSDINDRKLRKVLLEDVLKRNELRSAADALVKIDSAIAIPPAPEHE